MYKRFIRWARRTPAIGWTISLHHRCSSATARFWTPARTTVSSRVPSPRIHLRVEWAIERVLQISKRTSGLPRTIGVRGRGQNSVFCTKSRRQRHIISSSLEGSVARLLPAVARNRVAYVRTACFATSAYDPTCQMPKTGSNPDEIYFLYRNRGPKSIRPLSCPNNPRNQRTFTIVKTTDRQGTVRVVCY